MRGGQPLSSLWATLGRAVAAVAALLRFRDCQMPVKPRMLGGAVGGHDADRQRTRPSRRWYKLAAWARRRAAQLAVEPLCRFCMGKGIVTVATVADHVVPHREDAERFWNGALQSLCASCHSSAKQREERGGARVRR